MSKSVDISFEGKSLSLPVFEGTESERAIDVTELRNQSGLITFDPGYGNTGAAKSAITFIDGDKGVLRYRGIPIEQLAEKSNFVEVSYLLIYGKLPSKIELARFNADIDEHTMLHEDIRRVIDAYPASVHPMAILAAMACSLSSFYPETIDVSKLKDFNLTIVRMMAKMPTVAAYAYKKLRGHPYQYPKNNLDYCENLMHMLFAVPAAEYKANPVLTRALDLLLILHADHEQNCSTSTVRMVGSAETNLFASISAGICALWGPLHGGANEAVVKMLEEIHKSGVSIDDFVESVKNKKNRLMGFGHRVYKNFDPRAKIIKKACDDVLSELKINDPMLEIAKRLEERALKDSYFIERKLYPNVDFYSGVIYRALGIPTNMFTVFFALGRMPGWIAHWKEMLETPGRRIGRPRQIYTGPTLTDYVPIDRR
jgi:citrate synthase